MLGVLLTVMFGSSPGPAGPVPGLTPVAVSAGTAEVRSQDKDLCAACGTTGHLLNKYYESHHEEEVGVEFCSAYLGGDRKGWGAQFVPCARCRRDDLREAAEAEFDQYRQRCESWLAERRVIDQAMGVDLVHVRTEHFLVMWEPTRYKSRDGRNLDAHGAAHLFAERLEGMYADFQRLFGFDDERVRNKLHQVMVFSRLKTMTKASQQYLSMWSDTAAKLAGDPSILVTWMDRGNLPGDRELDRHIVHHVAHLLYSVFHRKEWLYEYGVLDEGLAHYFEQRYFETADNTCNQEMVEEDFGDTSWPAEVLGAVRAGTAGSVIELLAKDTGELEGTDHRLAWAVFDYFMSLGPEKVRDLMAELKEKKEFRESLAKVFGMTPLQIQAGFQEYVEEEFPARAQRKPRRKGPLPADTLRALPPPESGQD